MVHTDGDNQPISAAGLLPQTLAASWDNLPQLLVGALFLNLCAAPALLAAFLGAGALATAAVVLLGAPGWVALQWWQLQLIEGKTVSMLALLRAWTQFWTRGVRLGALGCFLPAVTYLAGVARRAGDSATGDPLTAAILTSGVLASLLAGIVLVLYAVPLVVRYDVPDLAPVVRNGLLLAARRTSQTVGMVALAVLCGFAIVYLSSGLIFLLPALYGMFAANNCRLALQLEEIE